MIYEAAVTLRPGLAQITLADPSLPLEPVRRPSPPPPEPELVPEYVAGPGAALPPPEGDSVALLLEQLIDVVQDLKAQQRERLEEMQKVAVEVAVAVASHVLYERIKAGDFAIEELVRRAAKRLESHEAVKVYLHPDDLAALERRTIEGPLLALEGEDVRLIADPGLGRGDCRAETGDVSVVTQLEEYLAEIRRDLLQALPEAQVERRRATPEERGLRRYPDRRHTA